MERERMTLQLQAEVERIAGEVCDLCYHRRTAEDPDALEYLCSDCSIGERIIGLVRGLCVPEDPPSVHERRFSVFWAVYPRKEDRKKALAAWMKLKPDEELTDRIIAAVIEACKSEQWKLGYIPHAKTYINGERWNDKLMRRPAQRKALGRGYDMREVRDEDFADMFLDLDQTPPDGMNREGGES